MEQIQRRYVKFRIDSLDIVGIGFNLTSDQDCRVLPVDDWKIVEPFFTLQKNPIEYYPLINNNQVIGFRRKELYEKEIVLNTEDEVVRALRSFENFIARCKIVVQKKKDNINLIYDSNYFDAITRQENLERLTLAKDKVYNLYITRKGDPFTIYDSAEILLEPFIEGKTISLPYSGPEDISVYVVAKDK